MKQQWTTQELLEHWTLTEAEKTLADGYHTESNQIACALLLKWYQKSGRFPQRKMDTPSVIIAHIASQFSLKSEVFNTYKWHKGIIDRHRSRIRRFLSVRLGTASNAATVLAWLKTHTHYLEEHNFDRLKDAVYEHYRELKIEPPAPKRVERIIHSAVRSADEKLYASISQQLTISLRERLDALLGEPHPAQAPSPLSNLRNDAGAATLENVFAEIDKLELIRSLGLPDDLFAGVTRKRLLWCKQRIAVEDLSEIRRHPSQIRYSLLAAFCVIRSEEITDTLVELLITLIHKMGSRAKHIVNREVIRDVKRVQGKNRLLYDVASASLQNPDASVRKVIYPVAPEQTLRDLVKEYKQGGLYEERIQTIMRGSYSNHYRRMMPHIVRALTFCAASEAKKPVIAALALLRKYADKNTAVYPEDEVIPLEGVVKQSQLEFIRQG